jgi:prophage regulatory protein
VFGCAHTIVGCFGVNSALARLAPQHECSHTLICRLAVRSSTRPAALPRCASRTLKNIQLFGDPSIMTTPWNNAHQFKTSAQPDPVLPSTNGIPSNMTSQECPSQSKEVSYLRLPQVMQRTGLKRSMIYGLQKRGQFPMRVQMTANTVGWVEHQVDEWCRQREALSTPLRIVTDSPARGAGSMQAPR